MKLRHPEHIVLLLTFVFMVATATLHIIGFILDEPQLLYWGRWSCVAMAATLSTPLLTFVVVLAIEKIRKNRDQD
jgi:hypothetical protein